MFKQAIIGCLTLCMTCMSAATTSAPVLAQENISLPSDIATGWGSNWRRSLINGWRPYGAVLVQEADGEPVRLGQQSLRFEVRPGDCGSNRGWDDCANDRERHELSELGRRQQHGDDYWYAWSMYVPEGTPGIMPIKTTLGQFHQTPNNVHWMFNWSFTSYGIENMVPVYNWGSRHIDLVPNEAFQGKWHDILVYVQWRSDDSGRLQVWINHEPVIDFEGATLQPGNQVFFKFGIYRSFVSRYENQHGNLPPTQVVYYDEIHRHATLARVDRVGIAQLQEVLAQAGLYTASIDGLWGPNTLAATNIFLTDQGLPPVEAYSLSLHNSIVGQN